MEGKELQAPISVSLGVISLPKVCGKSQGEGRPGEDTTATAGFDH